jgi:beta-lactamase superfamily II metal-dependent hydrolase
MTRLLGKVEGCARQAGIFLALLGAVLVAMAPPAVHAQVGSDRLTVHYLDVDQGAAAVLEFPCGVVLIDAGGNKEIGFTGVEIVTYLNALFDRRTDLSRRLDAVFVTHTHIDHNVGLRHVAEAFPIRGYIHNGVLNGSGRNNARWMTGWAASHGVANRPVDQAEVDAAFPRGLSDAVIDPLRCPRVDPVIQVLSGRHDVNPGWSETEFRENGNLQSLVIRVDYGGASFLFTGDLEDHAIETLVERLAPTRLLDVDFYAVGHHGSYNGTTEPLLTAMSPEGALVSAGHSTYERMWTAWAYGHPRRTLVEMLDGVIGTPRFTPQVGLVADAAKRFSKYVMRDTVFVTAWDGTVIVEALGDETLYVGFTPRIVGVSK